MYLMQKRKGCMHLHGNLRMLTSQNDVVSIVIHFNSVSSFEKSTINEWLLCYLTNELHIPEWDTEILIYILQRCLSIIKNIKSPKKKKMRSKSNNIFRSLQFISLHSSWMTLQDKLFRFYEMETTCETERLQFLEDKTKTLKSYQIQRIYYSQVKACIQNYFRMNR